jgi:hypothetical protein
MVSEASKLLMRRLVALLLSTALAPLQFAQITNQAVPVPRGTGVEVELLRDVSSKTLQVGQAIPFKLVRPIEVKGETLLPAGTPATGVVETVQNAGHWGKSGALDLRLQPLKLADGTLIHIDFPRPQKKSETVEKVDRRADAAMAYAYYFPLIPVAIIATARKGKPFTIRSGERYLVYVTSTEAAPAATPLESPKQ